LLAEPRLRALSPPRKPAHLFTDRVLMRESDESDETEKGFKGRKNLHSRVREARAETEWEDEEAERQTRQSKGATGGSARNEDAKVIVHFLIRIILI
jgi:hypothetical protein